MVIHANSPCKARETNPHEHVVTTVNMELAIWPPKATEPCDAFTENTIGYYTLGLCLFSLDMILLSFHILCFRRKLADLILIYGEFFILTHLVKFPGWCLSNRFVANRMLGFIRLALVLAFWCPAIRQTCHGHLGLRPCWWAPTHLHITQVWAQRQPRGSPWWVGIRDSWKSVQTALHPQFNDPWGKGCV